jgi:microcystin degradation protein MlrC
VSQGLADLPQRRGTGSTRLRACGPTPTGRLRHVGVEPNEQKILGLKSAVHFRGDFEPIAETVLVIKAPGGCPSDPRDLPYRKLKPGTRLGPKGPAYAPPLNG